MPRRRRPSRRTEKSNRSASCLRNQATPAQGDAILTLVEQTFPNFEPNAGQPVRDRRPIHSLIPVQQAEFSDAAPQFPIASKSMSDLNHARQDCGGGTTSDLGLSLGQHSSSVRDIRVPNRRCTLQRECAKTGQKGPDRAATDTGRTASIPARFPSLHLTSPSSLLTSSIQSTGSRSKSAVWRAS